MSDCAVCGHPRSVHTKLETGTVRCPERCAGCNADLAAGIINPGCDVCVRFLDSLTGKEEPEQLALAADGPSDAMLALQNAQASWERRRGRYFNEKRRERSDVDG